MDTKNQKRKDHCIEQAIEFTDNLIIMNIISVRDRAKFRSMLQNRLEVAYVNGQKESIQDTIDDLRLRSSGRDTIKPAKGD